jgi:Tol biopolymer transport system component
MALPLLLVAALFVVLPEIDNSAAATTGSPAPGRIAYYGNALRSLGTVGLGATEATTSTPLFPGPQHDDDDPSAQGSAVVWTSLRNSADQAQVYLQQGGGPIVQLTTDATGVQHPVLSPDGSTVAFAATTGRTDGLHDIWTVSVKGGPAQRITDGTGDNIWPTWSPDGSQLAFSALRDGAAVYQLYTVPVAGGTITLISGSQHCDALVNDSTQRIPAATRPDGDPAGLDQIGAIEPAWDPAAADRMLFTCEERPSGEALFAQLLVLSLDPGGLATSPIPATWEGWEGSWSPDGTTLAFTSHGPDREVPHPLDMICTTAADGTTPPVIRLQEDREDADPTWYTPTGGTTGLLIARDSAENAESYDLDDVLPDGSDPRDLGIAGSGAGAPVPGAKGPAYSPDGQQIAFNRVVPGAGTQVWIAQADGSDPRPLIANPGAVEYDPAWSPDGTLVAVTRDTGTTGISVIDVATGRVLYTVTADSGANAAEPSFSPDGRTLLFASGRFGGDSNTSIWSVNAADGSDQTDLTAVTQPFGTVTQDQDPVFSPDGTTIAFMTGAATGIGLMNADGSDRRTVPAPATGSAADESAPAWSPDGTRIAVTDPNGPDGQTQVELVDPQTGAQTQLTGMGLNTSNGEQGGPTWQPTADLDTTLVTGPGTVDVGGTTSVTVAVGNLGPTTEPAPKLTVSVPAGLQLTAMHPGSGSCTPATFSCALAPLAAGQQTTVQLDLAATATGSFPLVWSVSGAVNDPDLANNSGTEQVAVGTPVVPPPAPPTLALAAAPNPAYVGGAVTVSYTVTNTGAEPMTGLSLLPGLPAGVPVKNLPATCQATTGCPLGNLPPKGSIVVQMVLVPAAGGTYRITGQVHQASDLPTTTDPTVQGTLTVRQPVLTVLPPVGSPGTVTLVSGSEFPPGVPVQLTWNPGVTAAADPAVPGPDGSFVAQMVIVSGDQTGQRLVTATGAGFGPVSSPFLVTPAPLLPPLLGDGSIGSAGGTAGTGTAG